MKKGILFIMILCAACRQISHSDDITKEGFDFASQQIKYAFTEIDKVKATLTKEQKEKLLVSPRNVESDGSLHLVASGDWTSGFFPGELWYMYEYTGNDYWRQKAEEFTAPIEREKANDRTHDMGFKVYCSFGNGYRLTHNPNYKNILLQSAETLITRYKKNVGCLRSWDHNKDKWQCPVIIDNMMNLELLFWAFKQTNREEYYNIAVNHARTTARNHFRNDYSSYHVIDYDTITGEVLKRNTSQGYAHGSAWSRGQAWGLYGYTMCYRETNLPEFLEQAKHIARFIFTHPSLPNDLIPYWDYDAPNIPNEPRDVSAAAVTASALYELSMYDKDNADQYKKWADKIMENLNTAYRSTLNENCGFLLLSSTGSAPHKSEVDVPIVYADYYFLEALLRKRKLEKEGNIFI